MSGSASGRPVLERSHFEVLCLRREPTFFRTTDSFSVELQEDVMPMFGKRVDVPGGERRCARQAVILAASALGFNRSSSVLVPDVSERGARLQGRDLPVPGERLLINFGQTGLFATVAWSRRDQCGVVFDRQLDDRGLRDIQREADWGAVMGVA